MLLALDVGNTNITVGAFAGRRLVRTWRMATDAAAPASALGRQLEAGAARNKVRDVRAAVFGTVVPALGAKLERALRGSFRCPVFGVTPRSRLGIGLKVRRPREVGADRILNALGAFALAQGPAVVIDFGTATTFDCVSKSGDYLGGAILPGPRMCARALAEQTAQLPLIEIARPRRAIGKDTVECLRAGLYFGYLGMIEKMLDLTLKEMRRGGAGSKTKVFATGGLARLYRKDLPKGVSAAEDLTLQGLRIAYERLSAQ